MKVRTLDDYVAAAKGIHGGKYDYTQFELVDSRIPSIIVCPIHGPFKKSMAKHIYSKQGCPKCGYIEAGKTVRLTKAKFVEKANKIHGDRYDYTEFEYNGYDVKSVIICPIHGKFEMSAHCHLSAKAGCPACANDKRRVSRTKTLDTFIAQATKIHKNRYDYSQFVYVSSFVPGKIICPEHGVFELAPYVHTRKTNPLGCPVCAAKRTALRNLAVRTVKGQWFVTEVADFITGTLGLPCEIQGKADENLNIYVPGQNAVFEFLNAKDGDVPMDDPSIDKGFYRLYRLSNGDFSLDVTKSYISRILLLSKSVPATSAFYERIPYQKAKLFAAAWSLPGENWDKGAFFYGCFDKTNGDLLCCIGLSLTTECNIFISSFVERIYTDTSILLPMLLWHGIEAFMYEENASVSFTNKSLYTEIPLNTALNYERCVWRNSGFMVDPVTYQRDLFYAPRGINIPKFHLASGHIYSELSLKGLIFNKLGKDVELTATINSLIGAGLIKLPSVGVLSIYKKL